MITKVNHSIPLYEGGIFMESRTTIKSTKVTPTIAKKADKNIAKLGITISEYLRLSLAKAANGHVEVIDYFNTPEFHQAEKDANLGKVKTVAHNKKELRDWANKL